MTDSMTIFFPTLAALLVACLWWLRRDLRRTAETAARLDRRQATR